MNESTPTFEIAPGDNPYRHDHNPLNADFTGGICPACEWDYDNVLRDERGAPMSPGRIDAMSFYVEPDDPFDKFTWTVSRWAPPYQPEQGGPRASISTPNGRRPDGTMHTYWNVAHDLWEPIAVIICKAVNAEAHARYGTPNPASVYADDWRGSVENSDG